MKTVFSVLKNLKKITTFTSLFVILTRLQNSMVFFAMHLHLKLTKIKTVKCRFQSNKFCKSISSTVTKNHFNNGELCLKNLSNPPNSFNKSKK